MVNHKSFEDNLEVQRWIVRYIENKIGKTQATLLTLIFLIPGAATFIDFAKVSLSMNDVFLGITQDTYENPYLVTKLVPLRLWCTFSPFARNITVPLTPSELPIQRTTIENLDLLQSLSWRGL